MLLYHRNIGPNMRGKWVLISVSVVLLAMAAGALSRLRERGAGPRRR